MSTWLWVLFALLFWCFGCFALVWVTVLAALRHDEQTPYDDMVDVVADPSELDLDEVELYAHADYDAYRFGYQLPGERP